MNDGKPIRILVVEDSPDDAELLMLELRRSGYAPHVVRVETLERLSVELEAQPWDIVLSDFSLSGFTGLQALEVLKSTGKDIPFILMSGTVGEETAVRAMKAGAHDFFLKDRMARLGSAIERELREARVRHERRDAIRRLDLDHGFRQRPDRAVADAAVWPPESCPDARHRAQPSGPAPLGSRSPA